MSNDETEQVPHEAVREEWGTGTFDADAQELCGFLRPDELELAMRLHLEENWPHVKVTLKASGRGGSLGKQGLMLNYRDHMSYLILRIARLRAEACEEGRALLATWDQE